MSPISNGIGLTQGPGNTATNVFNDFDEMPTNFSFSMKKQLFILRTISWKNADKFTKSNLFGQFRRVFLFVLKCRLFFRLFHDIADYNEEKKCYFAIKCRSISWSLLTFTHVFHEHKNGTISSNSCNNIYIDKWYGAYFH